MFYFKHVRFCSPAWICHIGREYLNAIGDMYFNLAGTELHQIYSCKCRFSSTFSAPESIKRCMQARIFLPQH